MNSPTFQTIMSAAEEIIREKGCQHTTLQAIMERTGLSKGAIYHYVKSKDELFGKILLQYMEETNRSFMDAVQHTQNYEIYGPVEAIMTTNTKKDISNKILIYLLSQQHNGKIRSILDELHRNSAAFSVSWIKYGQENGAIPADLDTEAAASMFVTFSYGLRVRQLIDPEPERHDTAPQEVMKLIIEALKPRDR